MTTPESLTLDGCAPTPLASYLKALGVLRLISCDANHVGGCAADPKARGWWDNERFHVATRLNRDALCRFFLEDYAPSPIIGPWNGRAGFLEGDAGDDSSRTGAKFMSAIELSESRRLENMRRTIKSLRQNGGLREYNRLRAEIKVLKKKQTGTISRERKENINEVTHAEKQLKKIKQLLLSNLRATINEEHLLYLDACYVLAGNEIPSPLMGLGGSDGSRDFGVNYAQKLGNLFHFDDGVPTDRASKEIDVSLFDADGRVDERGSMGQYSPGQGGLNATTGYKGQNPQNSWDLVLAMEGAIVFSGTLTRRWGVRDGNRGAFPFTFEPTNAGYGGFSSEDKTRPRGEIWAPLWTKPAIFSEILTTFSEGRLTLGKRTARTGLDAARSVAQVGFSRGIHSFERYSIFQSDYKMPYQAVPLGRVRPPDRPRRDPIDDLEVDGWLSTLQQFVASKKKASARSRDIMRRLADALFQMTDSNQLSEGACNALISLGHLVIWMRSNPNVREFLNPPPAMSPTWIQMANDGSSEFRIATALANIGFALTEQPEGRNPEASSEHTGNVDADAQEVARRPQPGLPMAAHFAPIDEGCFFDGQRLRTRRAWSSDKASPSVVWGAGDLVSNMIAVLERRLVDGAIRGLEDKPLAGAVHARLNDVGEFLSGDFDDRRCAALIAGMIWVRPTQLPAKSFGNGGVPPASVPFAYAAIKPVFSSDRVLRHIGALAESARMPIPPGLVAGLRVGGSDMDGHATDAAVQIALARARASGLPSPFGSREGSCIGAGLRADRLAASLLIPIDENALKVLIERAFPGANPEGSIESVEDTNDAD